jgi:hypothetical protein
MYKTLRTNHSSANNKPSVVLPKTKREEMLLRDVPTKTKEKRMLHLPQHVAQNSGVESVQQPIA